jgi:hypothetical protein
MCELNTFTVQTKPLNGGYRWTAFNVFSFIRICRLEESKETGSDKKLLKRLNVRERRKEEKCLLFFLLVVHASIKCSHHLEFLPKKTFFCSKTTSIEL